MGDRPRKLRDWFASIREPVLTAETVLYGRLEGSEQAVELTVKDRLGARRARVTGQYEGVVELVGPLAAERARAAGIPETYIVAFKTGLPGPSAQSPLRRAASGVSRFQPDLLAAFPPSPPVASTSATTLDTPPSASPLPRDDCLPDSLFDLGTGYRRLPGSPATKRELAEQLRKARQRVRKGKGKQEEVGEEDEAPARFADRDEEYEERQDPEAQVQLAAETVEMDVEVTVEAARQEEAEPAAGKEDASPPDQPDPSPTIPTKLPTPLPDAPQPAANGSSAPPPAPPALRPRPLSLKAAIRSSVFGFFSLPKKLRALETLQVLPHPISPFTSGSTNAPRPSSPDLLWSRQEKALLKAAAEPVASQAVPTPAAPAPNGDEGERVEPIEAEELARDEGEKQEGVVAMEKEQVVVTIEDVAMEEDDTAEENNGTVEVEATDEPEKAEMQDQQDFLALPAPSTAPQSANSHHTPHLASSDRHSSVDPVPHHPTSNGFSSLYHSDDEDGDDSAELAAKEISDFIERDLASSVVDEEEYERERERPNTRKEVAAVKPVPSVLDTVEQPVTPGVDPERTASPPANPPQPAPAPAHPAPSPGLQHSPPPQSRSPRPVAHLALSASPDLAAAPPSFSKSPSLPLAPLAAHSPSPLAEVLASPGSNGHVDLSMRVTVEQQVDVFASVEAQEKQSSPNGVDSPSQLAALPSPEQPQPRKSDETAYETAPTHSSSSPAGAEEGEGEGDDLVRDVVEDVAAEVTGELLSTAVETVVEPVAGEVVGEAVGEVVAQTTGEVAAEVVGGVLGVVLDGAKEVVEQIFPDLGDDFVNSGDYGGGYEDYRDPTPELDADEQAELQASQQAREEEERERAAAETQKIVDEQEALWLQDVEERRKQQELAKEVFGPPKAKPQKKEKDSTKPRRATRDPLSFLAPSPVRNDSQPQPDSLNETAQLAFAVVRNDPAPIPSFYAKAPAVAATLPTHDVFGPVAAVTKSSPALSVKSKGKGKGKASSVAADPASSPAVQIGSSRPRARPTSAPTAVQPDPAATATEDDSPKKQQQERPVLRRRRSQFIGVEIPVPLKKRKVKRAASTIGATSTKASSPAPSSSERPDQTAEQVQSAAEADAADTASHPPRPSAPSFGLRSPSPVFPVLSTLDTNPADVFPAASTFADPSSAQPLAAVAIADKPVAQLDDLEPAIEAEQQQEVEQTVEGEDVQEEKGDEVDQQEEAEPSWLDSPQKLSRPSPRKYGSRRSTASPTKDADIEPAQPPDSTSDDPLAGPTPDFDDRRELEPSSPIEEEEQPKKAGRKRRNSSAAPTKKKVVVRQEPEPEPQLEEPEVGKELTPASQAGEEEEDEDEDAVVARSLLKGKGRAVIPDDEEDVDEELEKHESAPPPPSSRKPSSSGRKRSVSPSAAHLALPPPKKPRASDFKPGRAPSLAGKRPRASLPNPAPRPPSPSPPPAARKPRHSLPSTSRSKPPPPETPAKKPKKARRNSTASTSAPPNGATPGSSRPQRQRRPADGWWDLSRGLEAAAAGTPALKRARHESESEREEERPVVQQPKRRKARRVVVAQEPEEVEPVAVEEEEQEEEPQSPPSRKKGGRKRKAVRSPSPVQREEEEPRDEHEVGVADGEDELALGTAVEQDVAQVDQPEEDDEDRAASDTPSAEPKKGRPAVRKDGKKRRKRKSVNMPRYKGRKSAAAVKAASPVKSAKIDSPAAQKTKPSLARQSSVKVAAREEKRRKKAVEEGRGRSGAPAKGEHLPAWATGDEWAGLGEVRIPREADEDDYHFSD